MATKGVRLSQDTVEDARREAGVMSRTVSAQVEHWIRVGRAVESAPTFDDRQIKAALRGRCSPDTLDPYERAIYDVAFEQRMKTAGESEVESLQNVEREQREAGFDRSQLGI